jgi:hypothetical protein
LGLDRDEMVWASAQFSLSVSSEYWSKTYLTGNLGQSSIGGFSGKINEI